MTGRAEDLEKGNVALAERALELAKSLAERAPLVESRLNADLARRREGRKPNGSD